MGPTGGVAYGGALAGTGTARAHLAQAGGLVAGPTGGIGIRGYVGGVGGAFPGQAGGHAAGLSRVPDYAPGGAGAHGAPSNAFGHGAHDGLGRPEVGFET